MLSRLHKAVAHENSHLRIPYIRYNYTHVLHTFRFACGAQKLDTGTRSSDTFRQQRHSDSSDILGLNPALFPPNSHIVEINVFSYV